VFPNGGLGAGEPERNDVLTERSSAKHSLKYFFVPVKKRLVPGEEHPQNIRECAIHGELLRVGLGIPLVPSSHFLLEDLPNRRFSSGFPGQQTSSRKAAWLESA
jgi:hypothetical protein